MNPSGNKNVEDYPENSLKQYSNNQSPDKHFTSIEINNKDISSTQQNNNNNNNVVAETLPYSVYKSSPLKMQVEHWDNGQRQEVYEERPLIIDNKENDKLDNSLGLTEDIIMKDDFVLDTKLEDTEGDIDDDKDHDFNWNDVDMDEKGDADEKNTKRSNTYRRLKAVYDKYCFWHYLSPFIKRVVIAAIGSSVFITIGVCIYIYFPRPTLADLEDPNYTNVRDNVQVWMYWAAFMWHITWITTFMIDAVPHLVSKWTKFFRGGRSERVKSYLEYYQSLKLYIGLVIILAWNWGSWAFLIDIPYQAVLKQFYTTTIWRIFACLFVASVFLLVQKTIIQVIANRFHRFAFEDRIKNNKKAIKVLDILGKVEYRNTRFSAAQTKLRNRKNNRPTLNNQQPTNETIEVTSGQSSSVLTNDFTINNQNGSRSGSADILYSFKKNLKKAVINDHPRAVRRREELDINSDDYARKNAKKLYISLAYPQGVPSDEQEARRCLLISDFEPYFKTAQEAKIAFDIFDRDGNGDITRREFRDTVLHIYRERKDIAISMRDTSQVLGKIDFMLLIVSLIALLLTSFAIFNVEVWHSLVPLGSLLLAMTFVFGNTAKNTFESILFLFVTHPYDTGDYVLIDGQYLLVHNMGIMGTTFISGDGQTIYAPTTVLMTKLITNVRRSGNMGETIKINVDFRTTTEQFYELHDRLSAWVLTQHRDFGAGLDVRVQDIIDVNQLILNIWLPHKGNWQELGKRFKRKTRFMLALKDILNDLNIRYELPTQKITHTTPNGPSIFNNQSYGHASQLEVSSQSFDTTQLSTPSDPREAAALEAIKKERIQRGRYNVDHSGSASSTGDGGW